MFFAVFIPTKTLSFKLN